MIYSFFFIQGIMLFILGILFKYPKTCNCLAAKILTLLCIPTILPAMVVFSILQLFTDEPRIKVKKHD